MCGHVYDRNIEVESMEPKRENPRLVSSVDMDGYVNQKGEERRATLGLT